MKKHKRSAGPKGANFEVRDPKALRELSAIAAKLSFGEPLEHAESVLAGNILHMVVLNQDPRGQFYQAVPGSPRTMLGPLDVALHYRLLRAAGVEGAAGDVANAWGYDDDKSVFRIERAWRSVCDQILAEANDSYRGILLKEIQQRAEQNSNLAGGKNP